MAGPEKSDDTVKPKSRIPELPPMRIVPNNSPGVQALMRGQRELVADQLRGKGYGEEELASWVEGGSQEVDAVSSVHHKTERPGYRPSREDAETRPKEPTE